MKTFSARETDLLRDLDGIELAGFWHWAAALLVDFLLMSILFSIAVNIGLFGWHEFRQVRGEPVPQELRIPGVETKELSGIGDTKLQFLGVYGSGNKAVNVVATIIVPVLYFGLLLKAGNGRTPGKRLLKIRVVSLAHRHITLWHAVERALGYRAAALELGFGFAQFFIHPYRRCAQDRLAETIVVTERSYQALRVRLRQTPVSD